MRFEDIMLPLLRGMNFRRKEWIENTPDSTWRIFFDNLTGEPLSRFLYAMEDGMEEPVTYAIEEEDFLMGDWIPYEEKKQ